MYVKYIYILMSRKRNWEMVVRLNMLTCPWSFMCSLKWWHLFQKATFEWLMPWRRSRSSSSPYVSPRCTTFSMCSIKSKLLSDHFVLVWRSLVSMTCTWILTSWMDPKMAGVAVYPEGEEVDHQELEDPGTSSKQSKSTGSKSVFPFKIWRSACWT